MIHAILILNSIALLSGGMLGLVLVFLYKKYTLPVIKAYGFFHLILSLEIIYFITTSYLSALGIQQSPIFTDISRIIDASLIIAIPYFINSLISEKNARKYHYYFIGISVLFIVIKYGGEFLARKGLIDIHFYLNVIVGWVDFLILIPILYAIFKLFCVLSNPFFSLQLKSAVSKGLILILVFLPGFIGDIGWFHFKQKYDLLPTGFYFTSIFYLIWNTLILYGSSRYLLFSPTSKDLFLNFCTTYKLSVREQDICSLLLNGMSNAEIANNLFIEESTVKKHFQHIFKKANVTSRFQLTQKIRDQQSKEKTCLRSIRKRQSKKNRSEKRNTINTQNG